MAYADTDGQSIVIRTDFIERDLIRAVPGAKFTGSVWEAPLSWGTCIVMRGVFGNRLQVGPALAKWAWEERANRVEPCLALRELTEVDTHAHVAPNGRVAFPHQTVGSIFLERSYGALLADEPGAGKTDQVVNAVQDLETQGLDPWPVCVISPNSVKITTWEDTFNMWMPHVEVVVLGGSAAVRAKKLSRVETLAADGVPIVLVINWEAVRLHSRLAPYGSIRLLKCGEHGGDPGMKPARCEVHPKELNRIPFRTVVADEAHKMKDPKAKQTRAVWAVQHGTEVRYRFSLTGTPIANDPGDLWAIMHGIAPKDYPSRTRFVDRYCMLAWSPFGNLEIVGVNPMHRDEFFAVLNPRMRRMPKALVLRNLPPKLRSRRLAEMGAKQLKAYREISEGMITRLEDGSLVLTTNNLTQQLRLLQFSSSYAEVDDQGHVKLSEPSPKLDAMMEILDDLGGKPLVVCAESKQLIMLAAKRLEAKKIEHRLIVGGLTDEQRAWSLKDFQEGRARVMLFTIKAGGVGLTMTAADTLVFLQRSWSMLENKQAEDRVHRIGAEKHESISIIDVVAPGTIEETQITRLYEKMARLEEIVRDRETLRAAGLLDQVAALEAEEQMILASDLSGYQDMMKEPAL